MKLRKSEHLIWCTALVLLFAVLLLTLTGCAAKRVERKPFVEVWNAWAAAANERAKQPGTVSQKERELWPSVRDGIEQFKREMEAFYSGQ
jgi:hypothetical protein